VVSPSQVAITSVVPLLAPPPEVARNRAHLTRLGDYLDEVAAPVSEYATRFGVDGSALVFGIYEDGGLVGGIALVAVDPPTFGLGYWLAENACGRGLATLALATLIQYASAELGATDLYAGVTRGNQKSVAVLVRNGFQRSAEFNDYDRYHLDVDPSRRGAVSSASTPVL
jgi:RimJ/RimL family protein N-acetyltransferase